MRFGSASLAAADRDFICLPLGPLVLAETAIVVAMTVDAFVLARRARPDRAWSRLPVLPMTTGTAHGLVVLGRF